MGLCTIDDRFEYVETVLLCSIGFLTEIFVVALLIQMFYCYRIFILSKSKYAVTVIATVRTILSTILLSFVTWVLPGAQLQLSIVQLAAATATAIQTKAAKFLPDVLGTRTIFITLGV